MFSLISKLALDSRRRESVRPCALLEESANSAVNFTCDNKFKPKTFARLTNHQMLWSILFIARRLIDSSKHNLDCLCDTFWKAEESIVVSGSASAFSYLCLKIRCAYRNRQQGNHAPCEPVNKQVVQLHPIIILKIAASNATGSSKQF